MTKTFHIVNDAWCIIIHQPPSSLSNFNILTSLLNVASLVLKEGWSTNLLTKFHVW